MHDQMIRAAQLAPRPAHRLAPWPAPGPAPQMMARRGAVPWLFFSILFMACGLMLSAPAYAFMTLKDIPPLKYDLTQDEAQLKSLMEPIEETPMGNKDLAMSFSLPKNWVRYDMEANKEVLSGVSSEMQGNEGKKIGFASNIRGFKDYSIAGNQDGDIFSMLVKYTTPARLERPSEFRVRSIELDSLVSLENWFIEFLLQMGFTPEGVEKKSENRLEAQYTIFENGEPYSVRGVLMRTGSRIILAEYLVHQENIDKERDFQILTMRDFKLNKVNEATPVQLHTYNFVDIAKFSYPKNWLLYSPGIKTIDRMEASIVNIKGVVNPDQKAITAMQLNGRIDITLNSKYTGVTPVQEVKQIGIELKKRGLILGTKIEGSELPNLNPAIVSKYLLTYHVQPPKDESLKINQFSGAQNGRLGLVDYEYWLAVLQTEGRQYYVRLLTIGRGEDFRAWSENLETYRTLLSSISPINDNAYENRDSLNQSAKPSNATSGNTSGATTQGGE